MAERKKLGVTGILQQAFHSLHGNHKVAFSALLLVLIPLDYLLTLPTLNPSIKVDFTSVSTLLCIAKLIAPEGGPITVECKPISFLVSQILQSIILYFSVMAYNRKYSLNELLSKVRRTWKGLSITSVCAGLVPVVFAGVFFMFCVLLQMLKVPSLWTILLMLIFFLLFIFGGLMLFVYIDMMASVSLVVSIAEEGWYGLPALRRAGSLVRRRKLHGFVLMVLMILPDFMPSLVGRVMEVDRRNGDDGWQLREMMKFMGANVVSSVTTNLLLLFRGLVYTVYYYECKRKT